MLFVGYLRQAKRAAWQDKGEAEIFIAKNTYLGVNDFVVMILIFSILFGFELWALALFAVGSVLMILKQYASAIRKGRT